MAAEAKSWDSPYSTTKSNHTEWIGSCTWFFITKLAPKWAASSRKAALPKPDQKGYQLGTKFPFVCNYVVTFLIQTTTIYNFWIFALQIYWCLGHESMQCSECKVGYLLALLCHWNTCCHVSSCQKFCNKVIFFQYFN